MWVYVVVGKKDDNLENFCGCIDFFKVILDYNYERIKVNVLWYDF